MSEWRPIETAPRDTALLLWTGWSFQLGHYNTALAGWVAGWDHRPLTATHWMPLPEPPV